MDLVGSLRRGNHFKILEVIVECPEIDMVITLGTILGQSTSRAKQLREWLTVIYRFIKRDFFSAFSFFRVLLKGIIRSFRQAKTSPQRKGGSDGINFKEMKKWRDEAFTDKINELIEARGKPIVAVGFRSESTSELFKKHNLLSYPSPERAARVLGKMAVYSGFLRREKNL